MDRQSRIPIGSPVTGVAVPVSCLRTRQSTGVGEFLDLPRLGDWCVDAGLSLIQILPVNDTGTASSPYSAVSAFALNPIYIRLEDVPGVEPFTDEIDTYRIDAEARARLDYEGTLGFKMDVLYRIYQATIGPALDEQLDRWIDANPWVQPFAVYKCLKDRYELKSWIEWPEHRDPKTNHLDTLWAELHEFVRFYAWVQMHLDRQLADASDALREKGVHLKGDIPILMSVDSADVWAHRRYFNLDFGAGAPPDMFTRTGQSWGFPIYRWDEIETDGYSWWIDRLRVASRYYDAFRIDHVIGFFRIWSQPATEETAILGHYEPSPEIGLSTLEDSGFSQLQIRKLTEAWTTRSRAGDALGEAAGRVLDAYFEPGGDVDQHFMKSEVEGERHILNLDEPGFVVDFLLECHRDRALVAADNGGFFPTWYAADSKAVADLTPILTKEFNQIVESNQTAASPVWMAQGRKNLEIVGGATDMLPCAEDLGAVPDGLREVLADLGILSLKIERWELGEDGGFVSPTEFPRLSVSTPSVHDLATLRVWWEESDEHVAYYDELGLDGPCPEYLTTEVAEVSVKRNLESSSAVVVFQIQDLFSLTYDLRIDPPGAERINVPGSVGSHNWTYRIPVDVETLRGHGLTGRVRVLVESHRSEYPEPVEA